MVNIDENYNVCEIHKIIKKVKDFNTGSSPASKWLLYFNDDVTYNYKKILKGFLKIYVDLSYFENDDHSDLYLSVNSLNYEVKIYKDIVTPLVKYNICIID